ADRDGGGAAPPRRGQPRRPQARLADRAAIGRHLDFPYEAQAPDLLEIYSGSALYDQVTAPVGIEQRAEARLIILRREPAPTAPATRRVDDDHGVASDRMQRVGAAQVD